MSLKVKWNSLEKEWPKCEWVWLSDYSIIELCKTKNIVIIIPEKYVWAEASILFPEFPEKILHCCEKDYIRCEENLDGMLEIYSIKTIFEQHPNRTPTMFMPVLVKFCPFCGFEKEK